MTNITRKVKTEETGKKKNYKECRGWLCLNGADILNEKRKSKENEKKKKQKKQNNKESLTTLNKKKSVKNGNEMCGRQKIN